MINEDICFDTSGKPLLVGLKGMFEQAGQDAMQDVALRPVGWSGRTDFVAENGFDETESD